MRSVMRRVGIWAITLAVAACAIGTKTAGVRQVDTLYLFSGTGGAMAYSIDESGANLPQQYAPWRFRQAVSTSGPTFKAGTDKAALKEVRSKGFAVSVWTMTIDPQP
jgi:hypothetical protein